MDIDDEQLKMNLEELNKQSELYKNQLEDMKKKCYEELNQKYSQILQKKIEEIQKTIYEDVQSQNQQILDRYVQQFENMEKKREEDYNNSMSKIMMSNAQNEGNIIFSAVKTTHHGIKCNKCGKNPIIGYRYKCSICKNYNLCENCEEKNYETEEHSHNFIKMRNEEKKNEIKQEKKEEKKEEKKIIIKEVDKEKKIEKIEYKYELLEKNDETFKKNVFEEEKDDVKFEFTIVNKGNADFPANGKTKLIIDKNNSQIKLNDIDIEPVQGIKQGNNAKIIINIPKNNINYGEKKITLILNIDGKNIGNPIILYVICKSKKVKEFREEFNLSEEEYSDEKILGVLQKNDFDMTKAFTSLFDN
jgi:hypothetical protein